MLNLTKFALAASALGLIASCTSTTPYGPVNTNAGYGFTESQVENNRWTVSFAGNSLTDLKTVETYLLYRAAELTSNQGYDYFIMVNRGVDEDRSLHSMRHPMRPQFSYRYYHPYYGWRSYYDPFFDDVTTREITRYEATAEITMWRGPKPAQNPHAYNAEEVLINLSPRIQRAEPY